MGFQVPRLLINVSNVLIMEKTFKKSIKGTKIKSSGNYLKCWNFPGEIQEFPKKLHNIFKSHIFSKKGKIRIRLFSPGA